MQLVAGMPPHRLTMKIEGRVEDDGRSVWL